MEHLLVFRPVEMCLVGITITIFFILLLYQLRYLRVLKHKEVPAKGLPAKEEPASVILYACDQVESLRQILPALLTQDYPEYEVIVVNDDKDNATEDLLKQLSLEYKQLYHTYIPQEARYLSRKKLALTMGIKAAKYNCLLLTEPECRPLSNQWIRTMVQAYTPETEIVLGYCSYPFTHSFLQRLIAYENLTDGLQYLSAALSHSFFRGDNRNLSYRKNFFIREQGFRNHLNLFSGEDDLFIHETARQENLRVCFVSEGLTERIEPLDQKNWKKRCLERAASRHYFQGVHPFVNQMEYFFHALFLILLLACIPAGISGNWLLSVFSPLLFLLYYTCKSALFRKAAVKLHSPSQSGWLPLLDIVRFFHHLHISFTYLFRKKEHYTFWIQNTSAPSFRSKKRK